MPSSMDTLLNRIMENRLINAVRRGWESMVLAYRQEDFVPRVDFGWDTYEARMARYHYNNFYVHNNIYAEVNRFVNWYKHKEGLYKHIRGLRNPISRLVNIEKAKVCGGFINYESFDDGALPIKGADEKLLEAIRTLWQWSNMDSFKNLLVYQGSSLGDSAIKVIDDMQRGKVYLEVLDPRKVKEVNFDNRGNVKRIHICYTRFGDNAQEYEYSEIIDKQNFYTFYNGEPYAYVEDENGNKLSEWPNPYGFVPIEWVKHTDVGMNFGAVSFQNVRQKIDNLNDVISLVHDNIRTNVRTKYAVKGANAPVANGAPTTIQMGTDSRDIIPFLQLSSDGDIFPIRSELDIVGALQVVESMTIEIEKDLPQLSLQQMRGETGNASGVAIENLYSDAEDIIQSLQATYLTAIKSATQMAISIASLRRYPQFRGYNLNSYESGALDFDIRPKALFQDKLSKKEKIELALQAIGSEGASLLLPELGYDAEDIAALEMHKQQMEADAMRGMFDGIFSENQTAKQNGKMPKQDQQMEEMPAIMNGNGNGNQEYE